VDVYFVITPGVVLLDLAGPAEAFRVAAAAGANFRLHFTGARKASTSSLGVALDKIAALPQTIAPHSIVFLLGALRAAWQEGRKDREKIAAWLKRIASPDTRICSVCSGAFLLAEAGLLEGRRCTTHHTLCERLGEAAPGAIILDDRIFVQDGNIYTSAGITAGIDLALFLIGETAGQAVAAQAARELVVYFRRAGDDPQLSPWVMHRNHLHPGVHRAQDAILRDPARAWKLGELAGHAHMSVRNLTRLFRRHAGVSLTDYRQSIRIAYARQILSADTVSVEQVAERAGFASVRHFRRVWKQFESIAPALLKRAQAST
jgi:transcriptional regulator GlxA family with amidase domain